MRFLEEARKAELATGIYGAPTSEAEEGPFRKESGRSSALEQQSTTGVGQDREAELASNATDAMPSQPPQGTERLAMEPEPTGHGSLQHGPGPEPEPEPARLVSHGREGRGPRAR